MGMTTVNSPRRARAARIGLLLVVLVATLLVPGTSNALPAQVSANDNTFNPKEVRIDPGDTVTWSNQGAQVHSVSADNGTFKSDNLEPGDTYTQRFAEEGYYFYFCKFHGAKNRVGMAGWVVVGNPPEPPELEFKKDLRPTLVVPGDFPTIQEAVDAASPGSSIVIKPGIYYEAVVVQTDDLVIRGVDRFRTVLHGRDEMNNGITVDSADNVTVRNLTARNYLSNGVYFNNSTNYTVNRVDALYGRTYGIYAFNSYKGVIRNSFGHGSGDGAFYIGQCLGCSALIENVVGQYSLLGYSGTNATGVVIRNSVWRNNGVGLAPNTLYSETLSPNRGTEIINNKIINNNYSGVPAAGFSETGYVHGTGIWLAGTVNNIAKNNIIRNHDYFGVLVSEFLGADATPFNNEVRGNFIRGSGRYDLAYDGTGADNCFSGNDIDGATSAPMIQTIYDCARRPMVGIPWAPTLATMGEQFASDLDREQSEPPEPDRPDCQRGRPGCKRR
ncbi:MAG TPA: plastocyanin/azurin family copper-binding protein [Actinomycetota bacterium]|nr:plastocyanin/azurin family copper-binding protein [Actinomycetota bacterium]